MLLHYINSLRDYHIPIQVYGKHHSLQAFKANIRLNYLKYYHRTTPIL